MKLEMDKLLKTLNEITEPCNYEIKILKKKKNIRSIVGEKELRQEAIKWIKKLLEGYPHLSEEYIFQLEIKKYPGEPIGAIFGKDLPSQVKESDILRENLFSMALWCDFFNITEEDLKESDKLEKKHNS